MITHLFEAQANAYGTKIQDSGNLKFGRFRFYRKKNYLRPDLMRDRKRKTAFFDLDFSIRKKKAILGPILCEIENEKRRFSIRKKTNYLILRKAICFFLIKKSRSKNAVFRFRSAFRSRIRSGLILRKAIFFFLIEKSRSKNAVFRFRSRIRSGLKGSKSARFPESPFQELGEGDRFRKMGHSISRHGALLKSVFVLDGVSFCLCPAYLWLLYSEANL